jgi:cobalamin-dependent methionine synthase I
MLIVAERINASRKHIAQAILTKNVAFIQNEAKAQAMAGADYIDVSAEIFGATEAERLKWVIDVVREVSDLPFSINSQDPRAIKSILPLVKKTPLINSVSLKSPDSILSLIAKYNAKIVAVCYSNSSSLATTEYKVDLAGRLIEKVGAAGIPLDHLYIDPFPSPLTSNHQSGLIVLNAIEKIVTIFPGVHTICGFANVSSGLPARRLFNRAFLVAAIVRGLDSVIMDPTDRQLYGALKAALLVTGKDENCLNYIKELKGEEFE